MRFPVLRPGQRIHQQSASAWNDLIKMVQRVANLDVVLPLRKSVHAGGIRIKLDESLLPRPKSQAGTATPFYITGMDKDFFFGEPVDGGDLVKIALPYELRWKPFHGRGNIYGISYEYFFVSVNQIHRTATPSQVVGGDPETQIIIPRYRVGVGLNGEAKAPIWADKTRALLGVAVDDPEGTAPPSDVEWMDTNRAGRAWAQVTESP